MKHTPGPWTIEPTGNTRSNSAIVALTGPRAITVIAPPEQAEQSQAEANARLIAAAPDLLDALRRADQLITQMASVVLNDKISVYIPFGMRKTVEEWLRCNPAGAAIAKAEA